MGDSMDVDGGNISLDGILQAERRKQARQNSGAGRAGGRRDGKQKPRTSPGTNTPPGNPNGRWTHDLFQSKGVPNPLAARITKTPVGGKSANGKQPSINPAVAKSLANNPLFAAIAGGSSSSPSNNNNNNNASKKQVDKVRSLSDLQKNKGSIDIGATIRGTAVQKQKDIPKGPAADRRSNSTPTGPANNNNNGNIGASIRGAAGVSIRGAAGPFVVRASNFAQGTTADDIMAAMKNIGKIRSTTITKVSPTTSAEIVFEKKEAALACVSQFNGLKADGHILKVQLHDGPPTAQAKSNNPNAAVRDDAYSVQREMANLQRMQASGYYQDGTMGFPAQPLLYSDAIVKKGRGFQR